MKRFDLQKAVVRASNSLLCSASFIEKDYYVTKIIQSLSATTFSGKQLVFSGGTSLSKGYKIISRFSEDIDFIIPDPTKISRSTKKDIKHCIIERINDIPGVHYKNDISAREDVKVSIYAAYDSLYDRESSLRREILIELFFEDLPVRYKQRGICSYLCEYGGYHEEESIVPCRHPEDTMADKFSALLWRSAENDVHDRITRHLYDICAVLSYLEKNNMFEPGLFVQQVKTQFVHKDQERSTYKDVSSAVAASVEKISSSSFFASDYASFVKTMLFGEDRQHISFADALDSYTRLATFFTGSITNA